MPTLAPVDALLDDLNPAQREAVEATSGPLAILAGAGTGKTRVISRRTAYAIATGTVPADQALVVTFTDKAATEMVERFAGLGLRGVTARTFHAHALSQLRHFWPSRHDGRPLPETLASKAQLLAPIARRLPGHYRFTPVKDLADEIEWAKYAAGRARRLRAGRASAAGPAIPVDLMRRLFADYERAKSRADRLDFDDMLPLTVELLETDADGRGDGPSNGSAGSASTSTRTRTRSRSGCSSCGWASQRDVCVVGDEDQTIYTFAGATAGVPDRVRETAPRRPGGRRSPRTTARARRCSRSPTGCSRPPAARSASMRRVRRARSPSITRHPNAAAELEAVGRSDRRR